jgi:hypothetical protein
MAKRVPLAVDTYRVVQTAVEEGVAYGLRRAHKYDDHPTDDHIRDTIVDAVMLAVSEVVRWPDT